MTVSLIIVSQTILVSVTMALTAHVVLAQIDLLHQPPITVEQRRQDWARQQQGTETGATPEEVEPQPEPLAPPPASEAFDQLDIQTNDLTLGLKSVGVPYVDALPIPDDAWQGFDFAALDQLPAPANPLLRRAWRDVLLGHAYIPTAISEAQFLAHRLNSLLMLGFVHDSHRLGQKAGLYDKNYHTADPRLHPLITTALLRRDWRRLCPMLRPFRGLKQSPEQKRLNILCLIVADHPSQAALQLQLLREQLGNDSISDGFSLLVNMILLQETQLPATAVIAPRLDNLVLAMLGEIPVVDENTATISAASDYLLLRQPTLSLDDRLELAEAAMRYGNIDARALHPLQMAMVFDNSERATISTLITRFYSPRARALVVQQLAGGSLDEAETLDLLNNALTASVQSGDFALMLAMLEPFRNRLTQARADQLVLRRAALAWGVPLIITQTGGTGRSSSDLADEVIATLDHWQEVEIASRQKIGQGIGQDSGIDRDFLASLLDYSSSENEGENDPESAAKLADIRQWREAFAPLAATKTPDSAAALAPSAIVRRPLDDTGYATTLLQISQAIDQRQPEAIALALKTLARWDPLLGRRLAAWILAEKLYFPTPNLSAPNTENSTEIADDSTPQ